MALKDDIKNILFNNGNQIHYRNIKKLNNEYNWLLHKILDKTQFLNYINPTIKQRIWYILNDKLEVVMCKNCGRNPAKFRDKGLVQEEFCSRSCVSKFYTRKEYHPTSKNKQNKNDISIESFLLNEYDRLQNIVWKPNEKIPTMVLIKCNECGKWYTPKIWEFGNKRGVFCCSEECKIKNPIFSLNGKDGVIRLQDRRGCREWAWYDTYSPKISFCEYTKKEIETGVMLVKCVHCKEWFRPSFIQVLQRLNGLEKGTNYFYCSDNCKVLCPVFKKRKYSYGKEPYNELNVQKELKSIVFKRDNYTCQICGKSKEELGDVHLCCHHIDPIKNNPVESADVDNCISVCRTCHNMIHTNNCNYGFLSTCKQQW